MVIKLPVSLGDSPFSVSSGSREGLSRGRLQSPSLETPFYGVRALPQDNGPRSVGTAETRLLRRCREFAPRLRPGEYFSHQTAAELWQAPLPHPFGDGDGIHVSIAAPQGESRVRGVVGHKIKHAQVRVYTRSGLPVSDPVTTFIHLGTRLDLNDLVAVGDYLILEPRVPTAGEIRPFATPGQLYARASRYEGAGRAGCLKALALMRQGSESRTESLLRLLICEQNLPEPRVGRKVHDEKGPIGWFDLVYPQWQVVVEYDGDQHRTDARQYEKDMKRHARLARAGWSAVRVRKTGLFAQPLDVAAEIEETLRRAGWVPPA